MTLLRMIEAREKAEFICLLLFCSRAKGKVVIHSVLKFIFCFKNKAAKFRDRIETILYQKLNGENECLHIDSSSLRVSGKHFSVWYRVILNFSFEYGICYANKNNTSLFKISS